MNSPFFSVVIPSFNRLDSLKRAIDSVYQQTFENFELIIVDDGSCDGTNEYLNHLPVKNLSLGEPGVPVGVSRARNAAVELAVGEWLAFLDSDDEWLPTKLEKQYNFIQENPEVKIVHSNERWVRNGNQVNQMKKHEKSGGDIFNSCLDLCLISPSAVVIETKTFKELGGFREDFLVCEDYDLWLKMTSLYEVGFIDEELIIKYGGHDDQLSQKYKAMDYYRVKSMDWIWENRVLDPEQKLKLVDVLKKKCEILIQGYQKHQNRSNLREIELIYSKFQSVGV